MTSMMHHTPSVPTFGLEAATSYYASNDNESVQPAPSFSFPARPVDGADQGSVTSSLRTPSQFTTHRRARTSVNLPPAPLPSFSFNPSTSSAETETSSDTPRTCSDPSTPPASNSSPGRVRHRRVVTEFGGGRDELQKQLQPNPDAGLAVPTILLPTDPNVSASRGHRHRRSGAVSSKDLSSLLTPESKSISIPGDFNPVFRFGGQSLPEAEVLSESVNKKQTQATIDEGLSRSVEFSDNVEVIPRPVSMVSLETVSSQSTIRDGASSPSVDSFTGPTLEDSSSSSNLASTSPTSHSSAPPFLDDGMFADLSGINVTELDLNANFDDDDPTSTVISPIEGGIEWADVAASPATTPTASSFRTRMIPPPSADVSTGIIDLDVASLDHRPTTASGYERKRASMHNNHQMSGFLASSGSHRHRRAESAPSLAPPAFSASYRSGSSLGDGFDGEQHVLENVFEEDEEEVDVPPQVLSHSTSEPSMDSSPVPRVRSLPLRREVHSSPSLLPAIQFALAKPIRDESSGREQHDTDLPMPPRPFAVSETYSASVSSSPKASQSALSSCEPSPRYRKSVDDVPSLISGASTVGSVVHPSFPASSSGIFETGASMSGSTYSLASSTRRFHKKRGSIISLSRWIGSQSKGGEDETYPTSERPHTASGLKPPKASRGRRLGRMLKFWKAPKGDEASEL